MQTINYFQTIDLFAVDYAFDRIIYQYALTERGCKHVAAH